MTLTTWDDVRKFTDTLDRLADWRDDLMERIARRKTYLELVNAWAGADDLIMEVHAFGECCRELLSEPSAKLRDVNKEAA